MNGPETMKLPEEKEIHFLGMDLGNNFGGMTFTTQATNKKKKKHMALHQTKKILHSKRNH